MRAAPASRASRDRLARAVALAATLTATPALGTEGTDATTRDEVRERLDFITTVLAREARPARAWRWSWAAGYGALAAAQGTWALLVDAPGRQADLGVGATVSAIGFAARAAIPFAPIHAFRRLHDAPSGTPEERRRKLALAEHLLERSARAERIASGIWPRIGAWGLSGGAALTLWLAFDRPRQALITLGGGIVVAEAQFRTVPTGALEAWRAYRKNDWRTARPAQQAPVWSFIVGPTGGMVRLRF